MRRMRLLLVAGGFASSALVAGALLYASQPTVLTLAVGPRKSDDARLMAAIAVQLGRDRAPVRLSIRERDGPAEAAAAVENGETDLAVVRRDAVMPKTSQAIIVLRKNFVVVMALPGSNIDKIAKVAGRNIGVVGRGIENLIVLDAVLSQYEIAPTAVQVTLVSPEEIAATLRDGKLDVLLVAEPLGSKIMTDAVAAATVGGQAPKFLDISEADALVQRFPAYESVDLVAGTFGGNPQRPAENVDTIAYSHYIMARRSLDEQTAGELARLLLLVRQSLAAESPAVSQIKAPDTDKDATVPVHPGAAAYIDGQQKTFFERYGDLFYLGVMLISICGTALVGFASIFRSRDRPARHATLIRVIKLIEGARTADTPAALEKLQRDADALLFSTLRQFERQGVDEKWLRAFGIAIDQARLAIAERRAALAGQPGPAEPVLPLPDRLRAAQGMGS